MQAIDNLRKILPWCCEDADTDECRKHASCREHITDMLDAIERELAERYVELQVDADGEYIHVGDVMVSPFGNVYEVEGILPDRYLVLKGDDWLTIDAAGSHHHHAPTVEDVLDEIVDKANSIGCAYASNDMSGYEMMDALKAIVAEYAKRLKLAEGEDA